MPPNLQNDWKILKPPKLFLKKPLKCLMWLKRPKNHKNDKNKPKSHWNHQKKKKKKPPETSNMTTISLIDSFY